MGKSALLLSALVALSSLTDGVTANGKGFIRHKFGPGESYNSLTRRQSEDTDVCRWWGHASEIIGEKVYISGGMYTLHDESNSYSEGWMTVPFLFRSIDLRRRINLPVMLTDRIVKTGVRVNNEDTAEATSGGTLMTDGEDFLYKFGGKFPDPDIWSDTPEATVREAQLWRYDLNNPKWISDNPKVGFGTIVRPYFSAYASVPQLNKAFVVGGMVSNDSDTEFFGMPTPGFQILGDSFLELELKRGDFKNSTIPGLGPIGGASMVTIPEVGKKGILVLLGGVTQSSPDTWIVPSNADELVTTLPMDHVWIYDIDSEKWFKQKTYGKAPPGRMTFCATTVKSQDDSSFNIIINGGVSAAVGSKLAYADTWLLSLPSFTWVLLEDSLGEARFEHSCHSVKGNQLLLVGGRDIAQQSGRDAFDGNRSFYYDKWTCAGDGLLSVLDLDSFEYTKFLPEEESAFKVPTVLTAEIGGDEKGNADLRAPKAGYDHDELEGIFATKTTLPPDDIDDPNTSDTPTPTPEPKDGPPTAVIAGGVVGGVVVLAIIGAIVYCVRRRNRAPATDDAAAAAAAAPLNPDQHNQPAMGTVGSPPPMADPYFQQQQQQQGGYYPPQYPQQGGYDMYGAGAYAPPAGPKLDPNAPGAPPAGGYYSPTASDPRYSYAAQGGIAPVEIGGEAHQGGVGYAAYSPPPVAKDGTVSGAYEMPVEGAQPQQQQQQPYQ